MEINLNNAFSLAIKLPWGSFAKKCDKWTISIESTLKYFIWNALNRPKITTVVFLMLLVIGVSILSAAFLIFTTVFGVLVIIITIEGIGICASAIAIYLLLHICATFIMIVICVRPKLLPTD